MFHPRPLKLSIAALFAALSFFASACAPASPEKVEDAPDLTAEARPPALEVETDAFGIETAGLLVDERSIQRGETFSELLGAYGVPYPQVLAAAETAEPILNVRSLRAGKPVRLYQTGDSLASLRHLVYQPDPVRYVVFSLGDTVDVYEGHRPVEARRRALDGVITHSLYSTLADAEAHPSLAIALSEVYAWQIDFYRIQKGDRVRVLFEEEVLDGQRIGTGRILGAQITHQGESYYAIPFGHEGHTEFFDEHGESLRKAFLKSPLKFGRLTSRYKKGRFHPVLKRRRDHLGTDYAAPRGTPIRAVGDGVVLEAQRKRGNGNYVKIRHNATYTTGYLHMSRFAKGIRPGARVRQGDVIGYVGSTGLATGPHVCYRFWKNDRQVDPLREKIPPSHPVPDEQQKAFEAARDRVLRELSKSSSLHPVVARLH